MDKEGAKMPIDYELMGEIEQEMGSEELPELEAMPEDGAQEDGVQQDSVQEGSEQGGEELPELEAMPEDGVQQDGAQQGGVPEDGAQQDAGDVRGADAAQGASGGMPVEALALLGAQDQAQAMQMLEEMAVTKLVESGVPDAAAREIVALRKQVSAGYPRDAPARTQAAPAAQAAAAQAAPAEPAQGAQDQAASPTVERMARQIDYIRARTGVDMLEELRRNPDMLGAVAAYADGRGGMDIMGAYDALRAKRASGRARVPKSIGSDGGGASGAVNVGSLTDAQMDDIDRRVRAGERITF